jgi:hypothetical protein
VRVRVEAGIGSVWRGEYVCVRVRAGGVRVEAGRVSV